VLNKANQKIIMTVQWCPHLMLLKNKKLGNDLHYIEIYRTQELTFLKENQGSVKSYFHHPLSIKKISSLRKV